MWSSFIKHQKRRSIHHQWSVGSTWCLAVAGHAQMEWKLWLRWRIASPPLDLNSSTLRCWWSVRRWNIYIHSVTFSYKRRKSFYIYTWCFNYVWLLQASPYFAFRIMLLCDLDYLNCCLDKYNKKLRYREEHSASPHSSRHLYIGTSPQLAPRNPRFTRGPISAIAQTVRIVL